MYNVSNDYINKIHALSRTDRLTGTLTFKDGTSVPLTESIIGEGSVSISRACVDNDELNFGSAIMAELSISIRSEVSRYKFYGATISLTYGLQLDDDSWEDVPLGIFTVYDASRLGKLVSLHAYDNLLAFDKAFNDTIVTGKPYEILKELCDLCGVTFGMTASEFETIPNGAEVLQIDNTNGCKTFRDALKIVGQMLCGFIIADRDGSVKLKHFSKTSIATLTEGDRYSTRVEDFNCSYIATQITGVAGTYYSNTIEIREGLTLYIDDAPAWDYGVDDVLQARTDAIMAYLNDFNYTPCELSLPGNPSYECGDRITVSVDGELIETVIMEIDWQFRNKMKLSSTGTNIFNVSSHQETSNRIINRENASNKLEFYHYANPDIVTITENENAEICNIQFATTDSTNIIFLASVIVDIETTQNKEIITYTGMSIVDDEDTVIDVTGLTSVPKECNISLTYMLNGLEQEYSPSYTFATGKNTIALIYNLSDLKARTRYEWVVKLKSTDGITTIGEWNAKFTLFGQGLAAGDSAWDGRINLEDTFDVINIMHNNGIVPFTDEAEGGTQVVEMGNPTDSLAPISIRKRVTVTGIDSELVENMVYKRDIISTQFNVSPEGYNNVYVENIDKFTQRTSYTFEGEDFAIDSGKVIKTEINTSQFLRVDDAEVI
jgi:hypothetical protein